jgi:hypothetical protein
MTEAGQDKPPCSYEGYLSKGGKNLLVQYPKRYFRILGGALFWYKTKEDTSPLGEMLVNDITEIIVKLKNKDGIPFDVITPKRPLNLIAPNNEVLDYWLNGLGTHIKVIREPEPELNNTTLRRGTTALFKKNPPAPVLVRVEKNDKSELKIERNDKSELKIERSDTPDSPSGPAKTPSPTLEDGRRRASSEAIPIHNTKPAAQPHSGPKPNGASSKQAAAAAVSKSPKPLPTIPPGGDGQVVSPRPLPSPKPKATAQPQPVYPPISPPSLFSFPLPYFSLFSFLLPHFSLSFQVILL